MSKIITQLLDLASYNLVAASAKKRRVRDRAHRRPKPGVGGRSLSSELGRVFGPPIPGRRVPKGQAMLKHQRLIPISRKSDFSSRAETCETPDERLPLATARRQCDRRYRRE